MKKKNLILMLCGAAILISFFIFLLYNGAFPTGRITQILENSYLKSVFVNTPSIEDSAGPEKRETPGISSSTFKTPSTSRGIQNKETHISGSGSTANSPTAENTVQIPKKVGTISVLSGQVNELNIENPM